jgi:hypothetical protein
MSAYESMEPQLISRQKIDQLARAQIWVKAGAEVVK